MLLTFGQVATFVADWQHLDLSDEDLRSLEALLLRDPEAGKVIPGTGGARKVRFAPKSWRRGKSGAIRIIYAYFPRAAQICLLLAYGKAEQGNLTAEEKNFCREMLAWIRTIVHESE